MRNLPKGQPKIKDFVWVHPDEKSYILPFFVIYAIDDFYCVNWD